MVRLSMLSDTALQQLMSPARVTDPHILSGTRLSALLSGIAADSRRNNGAQLR